MQDIARRAETSTPSAIGELSGQMKQTEQRYWSHTSRAVGVVAQQLEKEIGATSSRVAAASEATMRRTVAETCAGIQTQMNQVQAESVRRYEENQQKMNEIDAKLALLTEQLNQYRPASVTDVEGSEKRMSNAVEERLNVHSTYIANVSESVGKAQKTAQDNAEIL